MSSKEKAKELLKLADVEINGSRPWDIQVHDERLYDRIFSEGTLGAGEAYMDGWWDVSELDQFMDRIFRARLREKVKTLGLATHVLRARILNLQSVKRAFQIGEGHYDVGNDLFRPMLGKRMLYTCGYWSGSSKPRDLDEAQEAKLDLVCKKIGLKKGQRVLDVGGGWGGFGRFAAEKYGAETVAITVSEEQAELGREMVKGFPVEIRLQDYRDVSDGPYDHVVSIGMFEHVGYKNYRTFMRVLHNLLKDDGLFLLHTIGSNETSYTVEPWMGKYIFPNGMLPSITQIGRAIETLFVMEDWHNFGADYDKTLMEWFKNFENAWPKLKGKKYDERFRRMWKFYLLSSVGGFRARTHQLWHIVLSKNGVRGGYQSVR